MRTRRATRRPLRNRDAGRREHERPVGLSRIAARAEPDVLFDERRPAARAALRPGRSARGRGDRRHPHSGGHAPVRGGEHDARAPRGLGAAGARGTGEGPDAPHDLRRGQSRVTRLDDPALVADEYADDARLRRRALAFTDKRTGLDARVPLVAAVAAARPERVLEVGCGWGELAEWIARETGADVVAVDLSQRMVELACERGVDARVGDVQELPFADGEFDVAIAAWMLYHVPDLDRGLAELARVLRPGCRLVVATNSRFHLIELRELVVSGPSTLKFNRENGDELLPR